MGNSPNRFLTNFSHFFYLVNAANVVYCKQKFDTTALIAENRHQTSQELIIMEIPQFLSVFIGDSELQYLFYDGVGPTIILVHATGFNSLQWHPIARELAGQYKIVVPSFCDPRDTKPEKGGVRWQVLANDMVSLCRHLEIEKPFMVGHSMGGSICILAHGIAPDMAEKMLLIEPVVLPDYLYKGKITIDRHPLAGKVMRRRNKWKDYHEVESYLRSKQLFRNWDDEMLKIYLDYGFSENLQGEIELTCSPRAEAAILMGSLDMNPWPLLPQIKCPVFILQGEKSDRSQLNQPKIAAKFPNGKHRLIPNAGHLIPMEKPKLIIEIIREITCLSGSHS